MTRVIGSIGLVEFRRRGFWLPAKNRGVGNLEITRNLNSKFCVLRHALRPVDRASIYGIPFSILLNKRPEYCRSGLWDFEIPFARCSDSVYFPVTPDTRRNQREQFQKFPFSRFYFHSEILTGRSTVQYRVLYSHRCPQRMH